MKKGECSGFIQKVVPSTTFPGFVCPVCLKFVTPAFGKYVPRHMPRSDGVSRFYGKHEKVKFKN